MDDLWQFDVSTGEWKEIYSPKTSVPNNRHFHSMVLSDEGYGLHSFVICVSLGLPRATFFIGLA